METELVGDDVTAAAAEASASARGDNSAVAHSPAIPPISVDGARKETQEMEKGGREGGREVAEYGG